MTYMTYMTYKNKNGKPGHRFAGAPPGETRTKLLTYGA